MILCCEKKEVLTWNNVFTMKMFTKFQYRIYIYTDVYFWRTCLFDELFPWSGLCGRVGKSKRSALLLWGAFPWVQVVHLNRCYFPALAEKSWTIRQPWFDVYNELARCDVITLLWCHFFYVVTLSVVNHFKTHKSYNVYWYKF